MNDPMRSFAVFLLLSLPACAQQAAPEQPPLAGATIGGAFSLTGTDGRTVTDRDFAGKYRLVYFGYTFCPDVCPVDLQAIGQAMRTLEEDAPALAAKVQPIFITTDPERDTPAVMRDYVAAFHPRLVGLTGTPEQIRAVERRYGVVSSKREEEGASDYLVDHSRIALLFGPAGEPIAILPHDQGAAAITAELRKWVR